uniref:Ubiquitin-like protease family profile domain-containing protein n=1 Tax=Oryza barthii TaxID=65489 RepID=A0A0D3H265_9ORYZ
MICWDGNFSSSELDALILDMYTTEVVQEIKKKLVKSSKYDFRRSKKAKISKKTVSFSRFSCKYFSEVVSSLSEHQKTVIWDYGFETLLLFDSSYVPKKFATWIARHVDYKSSEIILSQNVISFSKELVSSVFGLPVGGLEFGKDFEVGKQFILSKFGLSCLPTVRFFGDKIIKSEQMSDEEVIISFLIVALACFLCPNSSLVPSTKYLTIFEDVGNLRNYDWSKFIYDWSLNYIRKFLKSKNLGGCLFLWAVVYLNHVDFGKKNVANSIPRISVWVKDRIQKYSDFDKVDEDNYGLRPLRDFKFPQPVADRVISFKEKLESALGFVLPGHMIGKLCTLMRDHCSENQSNDSHCCEDILISALVILAEDSSENVQEFENAEGRFENAVNDTNAEVSNAPAHNCDDNVVISTPINPNGDASIPNVDVQPARFDNSAFVSPFRSNGENANTSDHAAHLMSSTNRHNGTSVVTPQNACVKKSKTYADENFNVSASATVAAIRNVAKKFKSRFPEFDNQSARNKFLDLSRPSFKLIDSDDDIGCSKNVGANKSYHKDSDDDVDITPSSSVPCISFRSIADTPETSNFNNIPSNQNTGRANQSSQNFSKRLFQDVTKSCVKAEDIYNAKFQLSQYKHGMSSSGGKLPAHGPRRIIVPARHACDPFVPSMKRRFPVSEQENRYYIAIYRLADSTKWHSYDAVDFDNVRAKFSSFGHSLRKTGFVSPFVISVFCRYLFLNNHLSKSKKNYFFPSIGAQLILDSEIADLEKVKKSFNGAGNARPLHLCDMLFFPIEYLQHWFLFVVDIKDRMLVYLDSLHGNGDDYFEPIMPMMLKNLQTAWDNSDSSPIDFSTFKIKFPPVPQQEYNFDSGIYVMKFMEIWSPRIIVSNEFTSENIKNIRVQYANHLFFNPKNKMLQTEVEDVVVNWFNTVKFPRDPPAADDALLYLQIVQFINPKAKKSV